MSRHPLLIAALFSVACAAPQSFPTDEAESTPVLPSAPGTSEASSPQNQTLVTPSDLPACTLPPVTTEKWWHRSVGYEIFVRSFQDGDGDGVGDLRGLEERLPYLLGEKNSLGADLVWLMPILQSPSYHGYDVEDYLTVEKDYGTNQNLTDLLSGTEEVGIRVIMDLVLNHCSDQHPWFLASASEPNGPERDFFMWENADPGWTQPWGDGSAWHGKYGGWYYGLFSPSMPDLNHNNETVQSELTSIARTWVQAGLDGFRLDAVRYLVETGGGPGQKDTKETHQAWAALRKDMEEVNPDALLLGEAWASMDIAQGYFGSPKDPELQMLFDFDGASAMIQAASNESAAPLQQAWCDRWENTHPQGAWGTFLTNHDMDRVATKLKGQPKEALRAAAALLLLSPGTPWIYYGEELGMPNGAGWGDIAKRLPMQWDTAGGEPFSSEEPWMPPASTAFEDTVRGQEQDPASLLSWYKTLIQVRKEHTVFTLGGATFLEAPDEVVALYRWVDDQHAVILIPLRPRDAPVEIMLPISGRTWTNLLTGETTPEKEARILTSVEYGSATILVTAP